MEKVEILALAHKAKLLNRYLFNFNYICASKREAMSQPSEQKHAGFNVPYLRGDSQPKSHLPNSCDPNRPLPAIQVKAVCAQRFGTDLHLGAGLGSRSLMADSGHL